MDAVNYNLNVVAVVLMVVAKAFLLVKYDPCFFILKSTFHCGQAKLVRNEPHYLS